MGHVFKRLARDLSGATLPMVAMSLTALTGFAALTVDLGAAYVTGQSLQATADAAALAAAEQLALTGSESGTAQTYARRNMPLADHGEVLAAGDVQIGRWNAATLTFTASGTPANAVRVTTRRAEANGNPLQTFLAGVIGFTEIDISRQAIAYFERGSGTCILSLRPTGTAVAAATNARLTTNGCSIHANSSSSNSLVTNSTSQIIAQGAEICTVGGVSGSNFFPTARTRCNAVPDPLARLPEPDLSACNFTARVTIGNTRTLNPGRYCRGIRLDSGANVTFNPGTYIIEGGSLDFGAGTTITGNGVTFILRDRNALLQVSQNSRLRLTAPTSGPYAGVAIYASRNVSDYLTHELNADTQSFVNGAIYLPRGQLYFNSRSQFSSAGNCMSIIAWDVFLASSSSVFVDSAFSGCGLSPIGGIRKVVSLVN